MPAAVMSWAAPAALGALGMYQQGQAQRANQSATKKSQSAADRGLAIQEREAKQRELDQGKLRDYIGSHDYGADTQRAIAGADKQVGATLEQRLRGLSTSYRAGGGNPGGSSEFRVRAQGVTNQTLSPLWAFVADRQAAEHEQKMRDQAMLLGQPVGQLSDGYFRAAQTIASTAPQGGNFAPSLQMLLQALMAGKGGNAGAGGSGDGRGLNFGAPGGWQNA